MLIGIVGKPNVGKSTFFKAATLSEAKTGNYPFVTIDANEGVGQVRTECAEKNFNVKCNPRQGFCEEGTRFVPVKLLDVAGLVPGAHEGKGLGNKFLDDLRQADVLIHVIDISGSTNDQGESVQKGSYNPTNDVEFLETEIDMWFYGIMIKNWAKFVRQSKASKLPGDKALAEHFSGLKVKLGMVKEAMAAAKLSKDLQEWDNESIKKFATQLRLKSKPIIIAANKADIDIELTKNNLNAIKKKFPKQKVILCSAESELALREADKKELVKYVPGSKDFKITGNLSEKQEKALRFIKSKVLAEFSSTGIQDCIDSAVFEELEYIPIFPGGVNKLQDSEGRVLPDVFLLPPNSKAIDFAYTLHSDFGDNFVRAVDVKSKRIVGRDHELKAGDVIEIISSK